MLCSQQTAIQRVCLRPTYQNPTPYLTYQNPILYYPTINQIASSPHFYSSPMNLQTATFLTLVMSQPQYNQQQRNLRPRLQQKRPRFDPIPMSYTKLLPKLIQNQLLVRTPSEPPKPPYPKWYEENASYDYHMGARGHFIENCIAMKHKVQLFKNTRYLNISNKPNPNVTSNLLPNHTKLKINAIIDEQN